MSAQTPQRVVVFIDGQNMYNGARRAFFRPTDFVQCGQFWPVLLGQLLTARTTGDRHGRLLAGVRIYTGRPDAYLQSTAYAANVRQCQAWERSGAHVFHRPLRYPHGWPKMLMGAARRKRGLTWPLLLTSSNSHREANTT